MQIILPARDPKECRGGSNRIMFFSADDDVLMLMLMLMMTMMMMVMIMIVIMFQ